MNTQETVKRGKAFVGRHQADGSGKREPSGVAGKKGLCICSPAVVDRGLTIAIDVCIASTAYTMIQQ